MKQKKALIVLLVVALLVLGSTAYYFFVYSAGFLRTENAKVTAKMYPIYPITAGTLLEWNVRDGDFVDKDEVLGRTQNLPYITSPIKGSVVQNNAAKNQAVSPTNQLAVIADTDHLYIGVNIEETSIAKISIGQTAEVTIDAYPGVTFSGTVTEIGSTTQTYFSSNSSFTTSGTFTKVTQYIPVKVEISNPDNLPLIFGMNSTVSFDLKE